MGRVKKFFLRTLLLVPVLLIGGAVVVSHDSSCPAAAPGAGASPMKAIVYRCYGSTDVMKYEDVDKPVPTDNQVLVKVRAAAVNPLDWHYVHGTPYVMRLEAGIGRPKVDRLGVDYSGVVEAVGKDVTTFKPGDEVFGGRNGAFAEYVAVRADRSIVMKPSNISFEQAAAIPVAALTALQALRDKGRLKAGEKVLVNGASGGVGTFAVQIAKALGAEVTAVCSGRNADMVRKLGADHVIDYTKENFTAGAERYDMIVDMVGSQGLLDYRRVLTSSGRLVIVGGKDGKWIGPLSEPIKAMLLSPFVEQEMSFMLAELNPVDLTLVRDLIASGKVTPVIDRTFALSEAAEAVKYQEQGHSQGKVVITMGEPAIAGNDPKP